MILVLIVVLGVLRHKLLPDDVRNGLRANGNLQEAQSHQQ